MIGVDLIGGIRRAYFEQRLPIKEIVRRLAVSRATVRRGRTQLIVATP
jgi:DNA-binding transcriptional regulator LsrR (DeoR family)